GGRAPGAAAEIALVLHRAGGHPAGAQGEVVRRRRARADLAPGVAADAAVAAGEEAQARRHRHQVAGPGGAGFAADDQAVGLAEAAVPGAARPQLGEAGIRADPFHAAAQGDAGAGAAA